MAALGVFLVDQISKFWVVEILDLANRPGMGIAPPFLVFRFGWNRGINFGFLTNLGIDTEVMRWALSAVAVAISAALLWWVRRRACTPGNVQRAFGAGMVIGGALSNVCDRIQYGAVADFLNMSCCGIDNPYAFNIADVAIFAGAVLIALKA